MSERMTDERLAELGERVEPRHAQELLYALQEERRSLRELEDRVKNGFQGGCYCCESVATKNIELEAKLRAAEGVPGFLKMPPAEALEVFRKSFENHSDDLPFDGRLIPNQWLINERGRAVKLADELEALLR